MLITTPRNNLRHFKDQGSKQQGFTLVELLMVIAVILILAGITFGISRGVQNAQARAKAKAELAVIAQGLEQFKSANGDYPWAAANPGTAVVNGDQLLKSLAGYMIFDTSGANASFRVKNTEEIPVDDDPRSYVDLTKISMNKPAIDLPDVGIVPTDFRFLDPWGNPYVYRYKAAHNDSWERFGYILFSTGADGDAGTEIPNTGVVPAENDKAIDNIYAGE